MKKHVKHGAPFYVFNFYWYPFWSNSLESASLPWRSSLMFVSVSVSVFCRYSLCLALLDLRGARLDGVLQGLHHHRLGLLDEGATEALVAADVIEEVLSAVQGRADVLLSLHDGLGQVLGLLRSLGELGLGSGGDGRRGRVNTSNLGDLGTLKAGGEVPRVAISGSMGTDGTLFASRAHLEFLKLLHGVRLVSHLSGVRVAPSLVVDEMRSLL